MRVSIRELRANTKEILDSVNRGVSVIIESHGEPCAQIVPISRLRKPTEVEPAFGMWKDDQSKDDVPKLVRSMRKGRVMP